MPTNLGDAEPPDDRRGPASAAHGDMAEKAQGEGADPLGPGQPIHQHGLGRIPAGTQSGAFYEPPRKLP